MGGMRCKMGGMRCTMGGMRCTMGDMRCKVGDIDDMTSKSSVHRSYMSCHQCHPSYISCHPSYMSCHQWHPLVTRRERLLLQLEGKHHNSRAQSVSYIIRVGQNHTYTYIRWTCGIFCRGITIHTAIYGVYIRCWPTLYILQGWC